MASRRKRAKQQPKYSGRIIPIVLLFVVVAMVGLLGLSAVGMYAVAQSWLEDLPDIKEADMYNYSLKSKIYAADGTLLAELYLEDREPVTSSQVSQNVFNATIAIEDERFWEHNGVDYYGIARALVSNFMGEDLQGASTITQQFVRQTILKKEATEISLKRKLREAALAIELEKEFGKQEVLMMYLNTINYGDGAYGIQSAAQHYFSKDASQLTVPEAALLAGIPQNPTYNNPIEYPDYALKRRNMVLDRMYKNKYITAEERDEYKAMDLGLNPRPRGINGIYAEPYFVSYVIHVLLNDPDLTQDQLFKGGLTIYTTINRDFQWFAEEACANKEAQFWWDPFVEVSLCAVDPKTGHILVMRGGKDFYTDQFNTCWQMKRQPGSSFKTFALVAALERGYSPETEVSGKGPLEIVQSNGQIWKPENYGGAQHSDKLTLAKATWDSSNIAYARVIRTIGAPALIDVAKRMGITTPLEPHMSIVLGAQGVSTLEMASAYATIANGGIYREPTAITRIVDQNGNVVYDHEAHDNGVRAISPEVAYAATEVLKGVVTNGTAGGARIPGQVSAGKTGTSENFCDSWYVGFTPQVSCAVWIGARDLQREIKDNQGGVNCCPVWKQFMTPILTYYEWEDFPRANNPFYNDKLDFMNEEERKEKEEKEKEEKEKEALQQAEELEKNKPKITSATTLTSTAGTAKNFALTASGKTPITWSATNLPTGVTLSGSTLRVAATVPAGTYTFTIKASNSTGIDATQTITLKVEPSGGGGTDPGGGGTDPGAGGGGGGG